MGSNTGHYGPSLDSTSDSRLTRIIIIEVSFSLRNRGKLVKKTKLGIPKFIWKIHACYEPGDFLVHHANARVFPELDLSLQIFYIL